MELEKTLFRVHERLLTDQYSKKVTLILMILTFLLTISSLFIFVFVNYKFEGKSRCIPDQNNASHIYNYILSDSKYNFTMIVSNLKEFVTMNQTLLINHNFTISNLTIPKSCFFENFLIQWTVDIDNIIINDLVWSNWGKHNLFIKNNKTNEIFGWNAYILSTYRTKGLLYRRIQKGVIQLLKILLALFIQSGITSLYIKMTIICAPIFILILLFCISKFGNRDIQFNVIYRAFPWIGVYLNLLDLNNRSKACLILSFFLMLALFYFVYLSSIFVGSILLFEKSLPKGIDESVFGFMALIEFAAILFFRTRTTIYYAPKMIMMYYTIYLFYVQYSLFGFFILGFQCTLFASLCTVFWFIYYVEIPALSWSPISPFTPCLDRPRCLYLAVFSLSWVNDLPHIWTMFYPLNGRRFFNLNQLALVDRNFLLLNQQLNEGNANDIEINQQQNQVPNQEAENQPPVQLQIPQYQQQQQGGSIQIPITFQQEAEALQVQEVSDENFQDQHSNNQFNSIHSQNSSAQLNPSQESDLQQIKYNSIK